VSQPESLLRAVQENQDDDAPRLVYADWLEEHGDAERAEFIRAQVAAACLPEGDPRRDDLEARAAVIQKARGAEWLRPLQLALGQPRGTRFGRGCAFRRGFLTRLSISPERPGFLAAAADALRGEPVEELSLTGHDAFPLAQAVEEIAAAHCLGSLRRLYLCGSGKLTAASLGRLGSTPHLPRLVALGMSLIVPAATLAGLATTPLSNRLRNLWLDVARGDTPALLKLLTGAPFLPALTSLGWFGGTLDGDGLRRLAHSANLSVLGELQLFDTPRIGPLAPDILRDSPLWGRLTELSFQHCRLNDGAVSRLVAALPGSRLRKLELMYAGLTLVSAAALAEAPSWGPLEELDLAGNRVGDAGVAALAGAPALAGLRTLVLSSCGVGEAGARALAASPHAGGLRRVRLYESDLGPGPRRALRKRFGKAFHFDP
jgi:uncharacterized protein (TIGR02996 family)